jgi:hypothetical protein
MVRLLFLSLATLVIGAGIVLSNGDAASTPGVRLAGPPQVVFHWARDACEPSDIPDAPARAFRDFKGRVVLLASHDLTRRMIGPDLNNIRHNCKVIMASRADSHPARFADREWIMATYTRNGKRVYALIDDEYHGHRYPGRCPSGNRRKCWYNALTLAVSRDGGRTFRHAHRPPRHLVASLPYRYRPDGGPFGLFAPSNIVYRQADGYYYTLTRAEQIEEQATGVCVMRTRHLSRPSSWRAWDGQGFRVKFVDPYKRRSASPGAHVCQPVARQEITKMTQSLTYSTYFNQFLLVGIARYSAELHKPVTGVYFSLSSDLIHWTQAKLLMEAEVPQAYHCGDPAPILYPSVLDPSSPSRNFTTTGSRPYLYFTRWNLAGCRRGLNRDLVRVPIEFSK